MKEFGSCKIFLLFIFSREKAVLAVTLCNDKEEILGHAAFFDYPNIDDVDKCDSFINETTNLIFL
jgi:hypothetical protein